MEQTSNQFFQPGKIVDNRWVIIELVGKGAMGEVYRAHQLNLNRDVAIKIISTEMLQSFEDDFGEIETAFGRFQREVQTMAQVRHSNILQIFDYGTVHTSEGSQPRPLEYIVMEYIAGDTLRYTMSEEGFLGEPEMAWDWLKRYFIPVLNGVEVMHQNRIVHRDLKPENVLMDVNVPKIADFGLARSDRMRGLSNSYEIKGTVAYMAPEQYSDFRKADNSADIYALGKILFEAIGGKMEGNILPFKAERLDDPDTPFFQYIDKIIQAATAEKKESRFQTIAEFRKAIETSFDLRRTEKHQSAQIISVPAKGFQNPKWIWAGIILAIFSVGAMTLWHLAGEPGKQKIIKADKIVAEYDPSDINETVRQKQVPVSFVAPTATIMGKDGITMLLVGEKALTRAGTNAELQLSSTKAQMFYVDRTKVTNHHYAEFLNEVRKTITVSNGVVRSNNEIWFYLGIGEETFGQIIYKHGKFHLKDPIIGGDPVVRVTYYGARAYAQFFGKQLLTINQWLASAAAYPEEIIHTPTDQTTSDSIGSLYTHMRSVGNARDIRNHSMEDATQESIINNNINKQADAVLGPKEWVRLPSSTSLANPVDSESRVIDRLAVSGETEPQLRYPWEGFQDVGFRTAVEMSNIQSQL